MFVQPACPAALTVGLPLVWLPGWRVTAAIGVGSAATLCIHLQLFAPCASLVEPLALQICVGSWSGDDFVGCAYLVSWPVSLHACALA
jgi:hypothetical protein